MRDAVGEVPPSVGGEVGEDAWKTEQVFLGTLAFNPTLLVGLEGVPLKADNFSDPIHGEIYDAIQEYGPSEQASIELMQHEFGGAGGRETFSECLKRSVERRSIPDEGYVRQLARIIIEKHAMREAEGAMKRCISRLRGGKGIREALAMLLSDGENILSGSNCSSTWKSADEAVQMALEAADYAAKHGHMRGVPTGYADLDEALGGLKAGELTMLGARPGMGKSGLALGIAKNIARQALAEAQEAGNPPLPVLLFTIEMASEIEGVRLLANGTGVSGTDIARGKFDFDEMYKRAREVRKLPIYFMDDRSQSMATMRAAARSMVHRFGGAKIIIVDHLHIVDTDDPKEEYNSNMKIDRITRKCRKLAKDLNVPVLLLGQLNREVERREDKRPTMADWRDSGTIEQNADACLFIYRESYYLEQQEPKHGKESDGEFQQKWAQWKNRLETQRNLADIIIAKGRNGAAGKVIPMAFDGPTTTFSDLPKVPMYR